MDESQLKAALNAAPKGKVKKVTEHLKSIYPLATSTLSFSFLSGLTVLCTA